MKNIFNKTIMFLIAGAGLFFVSGCNLDIDPSDSLTGDKMKSSPNGLTDVVNGCYSVFKDYQTDQGSNNWYLRQYYQMADFSSDDIVYGHETEDNLNMIFRYPDRISSLDNFTTFWTNSYKIIYSANVAYELASTTSDQTDLVKHLKGEALFLKAYAMHELVRLYAKPYTQANPETDPGIIIRESTTDVANKGRATLKETYDYIVKCLLEAETTMEGTTSDRDDCKGYASIWAVRAELSRVYLYMGNWDKAKEYATKVIESGKFTLETPSDVPGYVTDATNAAETVWCIIMIASDDKESASIASMIMSEGDGCWGEEGYSPSLLADMGMGTNAQKADVRFKFVQDPVIKNGLTLYPCSKYSGQDDKKTCASPILIRLSEMYFNRAEAEANTDDAKDAIDDINTVREQRIDPAAVPGTKMEDYLYKETDVKGSITALDLVLKEKRIEYCFEAHRFFDLMRYGRDIVRNYWGFHIPTFSVGQSTSSAPGLDVDQVVTKATYDRLVFPIPEQEINNNPECGQNTGY
jgi:tetratricopeptide (TPR) repeat protein